MAKTMNQNQHIYDYYAYHVSRVFERLKYNRKYD